MEYTASILENAAGSNATTPLPREVVTRALDLRNSAQVHEASIDAAKVLELSSLSAEDHHLFITRVFGNQAIKFVFASQRSGQQDFFTLAEHDQSDVLATLSDTYAAAYQDNNPSELLTNATESELFARIPNTLIRAEVYATRRNNMTLADKTRSLNAYLNILPATFPASPYHIAPIGENDITLVQAFGRDSITDDELVTIRDMQEQLGDDTAMMAYLDSINFEPGPSNNALADRVATQLLAAPIEQALQWEVAYALYKGHRAVYDAYKNYTHTLWPHSGFYPTYEVKQDSVAVMDRFGLYNAEEFAHRDMMARAVGILEKLGVQPDPVLADIPYDPESTQPHVHSARTFMGREALARVEHILRRRVRLL